MKYDSYQRLSWKTFFIMLLKHSFGVITFSFIWIFLVFLKAIDIQSFLSLTGSDEFKTLLTKALDIVIVFGFFAVLVCWIFVIVTGLIKHLTFYFMLDEHGISIKKGLLHKTEKTTPLRHIENIDIIQPLLYQILSVAKMHIMTGEEDGGNSGNLSEIKFPIIEKSLADDLKKEIFSRISVQMAGPRN